MIALVALQMPVLIKCFTFKLQNQAYEGLLETSLEWIMKTKDVVGIRFVIYLFFYHLSV